MSLAGIDILSLAVGLGIAAATIGTFWLIGDEDFRDAMDGAWGDVRNLDEELTAGRNRGGEGGSAADRRGAQRRTHCGDGL